MESRALNHPRDWSTGLLAREKLMQTDVNGQWDFLSARKLINEIWRDKVPHKKWFVRLSVCYSQLQY